MDCKEPRRETFLDSSGPAYVTYFSQETCNGVKQMPRASVHPRLPGGPRTADTAEGGRTFFSFLRSSHLFSSAVCETLEALPLREATPLPLTLPHLHLLRLMAGDGPHRLGAVAGFLGISPPAATKNTDKLESLGLVVRTPSKRDRRATLLTLSPAGRRLMQEIDRRKLGHLAPILEAFDPKEIELFSQLLERIAVTLLAKGDLAGDCCLRCAAYIEKGCSVARISGGCSFQDDRSGIAEGEAAAKSRGRTVRKPTTRSRSAMRGPTQGSAP